MIRWNSVLAMPLLGILFSQVALAEVFFDDFNRDNGAPERQWVEHPSSGGVMSIVNDELASTTVGIGATIYREWNVGAATRVQADISPTVDGQGAGDRFGNTFYFSDAPGTTSGYGVSFQRTSSRFTNSSFNVFGPGGNIETFTPSFQWSGDLALDFTFDTVNKAIIGSITNQSSQVFDFNVDTGTISQSLDHFGLQIDGPGRTTSTLPSIDNLRLNSFDISNSPTHSLFSPMPKNSGLFAFEVSSFGDQVAIGEPQSSGGVVSGGGSVHLFDIGTDTPKSSIHSPAAAGGFFGGSITPVGDKLLVGAGGAARAFLINPDTGLPDKTYTSPNPNIDRFFGNQVATLGNDLIIADSHENGNGPGSVYRIDKSSGQPLARYQVPGASENDLVGRGLTTVGSDTVIVGVPNSAGGTGSVYVYNADGSPRNFGGSGNTLIGGGLSIGDFNTLAALDADHVLVGDKSSDIFGVDAGAAYIFNVRTGEQVGSPIYAPIIRNGAKFGTSVAALGDNLLIGATGDTSGGVAGAGAAYLFNRSGELLRVYENPTPNSGDNFGGSLDFVGNQIAIGAPHDDTQGNNAGAAYLFGGIVIPEPDPLETRWVGGFGDSWALSVSWDLGVPNSQVHAIIDGPAQARVDTLANAKSLSLGLGSGLSVRTGGDLRIAGDVTQRASSTSVTDNGSMRAQNIDLTVVSDSGPIVVAPSLSVSGVGIVNASKAILLPERNNLSEGSSLQVSGSGSVRASSIVGGFSDPIGTNSIAIQGDGRVDVNHLKVGRVTQSGGILQIRNSATIVSGHFLGSSSTLQINPKASYHAGKITIANSGAVQLSNQTSFSVDGNKAAELNVLIADGRITRNGSSLGLLTTQRNENTSVVYAPNLGASETLDNSNFNDLTVHNEFTPESGNAIILVHGWDSSPSETWRTLGDSANKDMVNTYLSYVNSNDPNWAVATYDWEVDAEKSGLLPRPIPQAKANAYVHGSHLAQQIIEQGYEGNVHLIAHSLGGRVIDTASQMLNELGWEGTLHLTFLDAYTPDSWEYSFGESIGLGDDKTTGWADHYFHGNPLVLNTQDSFTYAHNVDLSNLYLNFNASPLAIAAASSGIGITGGLRPIAKLLFKNEIEKALASHSVPIEWYYDTLLASLNGTPLSWQTGSGAFSYGFGLSSEAGFPGWVSSGLLPTVNTTETLFSNEIGSSVSQLQQVTSNENTVDSFIVLNQNDPSLGLVTTGDGSHLALSALLVSAPSSLSRNDVAYSIGTANSIDSLDPVWANIELLLDDESNAISFDLQFSADAHGMLTVFVDGEPIWLFAEQYSLFDGQFSSGLFSLGGILPAGLHSLGFRLDSLDGIPSEIQISNVQTLLVSAVPEPSSVMLLFSIVLLWVSYSRSRASSCL